jgi:competence protein ComGF
MFHVKDNKQGYIFDQFEYLGPKRLSELKNSWAEIFRSEILPELPVESLRKYYHDKNGRPSKEMYAMLGLMILQQMHDLTDEKAVGDFMFDIRYRYALDVPGDSDREAYVSLKSLWTMRKYLTEEGLYVEMFEKITNKLAEVFKVDFDKQRLDSVHIQSNMRHLGRIALFSRTIRKFLLNLKRQQRVLYDQLESSRFNVYLNKKEESLFAAVKPTETIKTLSLLAEDTHFLLQQFSSNEKVKSMSSFQLLCRLFKEQCTSVDDLENKGKKIITAKPNHQVPTDSLQNPSDEDAGYSGHKGQGYQVQLMETYSGDTDKKQLSLITHIEVESADKHDANALLPALKNTDKRDMSPKELLADSLYGSDDNLQKAKQDYQTDVLAPVMGAKNKGFGLEQFTLDNKNQIISCPQGKKPLSVKKPNDRYIAKFSRSDCGACTQLINCPVSAHKKAYTCYYDEKMIRISKRRQNEDTDSFRDLYRYRAGIEATISEYDRLTGVKHLRVRGLKAVSYAATLKALGLNILRSTRFKYDQKAAFAT